MNAMESTIQSLDERLRQMEALVGDTETTTSLIKHISSIRGQIKGLMASHSPLQEFAQLIGQYRLWNEVRQMIHARDSANSDGENTGLTTEQKLAVIKSFASATTTTTPTLATANTTTTATATPALEDYLQTRAAHATSRELAQVAELLPQLLAYVDRVYAMQRQVDQLSVATAQVMSRWLTHAVRDNERWTAWERRLRRAEVAVGRVQRQRQRERQLELSTI